MLNLPKKPLKFKKTKKGKLVSFEIRSRLTFGKLGLKSTQAGIISSRQIESARQCITRKTNRKAKIWIKIFPNLPITSKSIGARMGGGKGELSHWGARIRGGTVLFEVCGANFNILIHALKSAGAKLPVKTKIFQ